MITDDESLSKLLMDDESNDFLGLNPENKGESNKNSEISSALFDRLPLTLTLEVGSVSMTLGDLKAAKSGDVIPLGRKNGDLLDVKVNGELFAKAEVVTVDNCYALRFVGQPD